MVFVPSIALKPLALLPPQSPRKEEKKEGGKTSTQSEKRHIRHPCNLSIYAVSLRLSTAIFYCFIGSLIKNPDSVSKNGTDVAFMELACDSWHRSRRKLRRACHKNNFASTKAKSVPRHATLMPQNSRGCQKSHFSTHFAAKSRNKG
jgi:hypothetical protein